MQPDSQILKYDIMVLGAGLGGLLCAAFLSKEGYRVGVVDKNKQIGGSLQSFSVKGHRFESAVHYVGSLNPNQTLFRIFNYLGILDALDLQKLDPTCFDEIIIGQERFQLAQGYELFQQQLTEHFPHQKDAIQQFLSYMREVCLHFPLYNLENGDANLKSKVSQDSLADILDRFIQDSKLKAVLCGHHQLYAGVPDTTPFYLHALIQNSYIEGSYKFASGSARLAKVLQDLIQDSGGKVYRNAQVIRLKEEAGKIQELQLEDGRIFQAEWFISNIPPGPSFDLLESKLIKPATRKRIASTPHTVSAAMLNIVLKKGSLPFVNHNRYYHRSEHIWDDLRPERSGQIQTFGVFYYQDSEEPGFASGLSVLVYRPFQEWLEWANTFRTTGQPQSRGQDYENKKNELSREIISGLAHWIPDLASCIETSDLCTPLTYRDYLHIPEGSMYGFQKNVDDLANTTYATRTKIPNLLLTGQNINLHGVLGVSVTAVLTCAEILGLDYLLTKMKS
jgi:all-trans-retinol 13,14-reductase